MRIRNVAVPAAGIALLATMVTVTANAGPSALSLGDKLVGRQADGTVVVPENKIVEPVGDTIEQNGRVGDLEISPDGTTAVNFGRAGFDRGTLTVVDLESQEVVQRYTPPSGVGSGTSVGGLLYSADGRTLWAAQTENLLRLDVAADGTLRNPQVIDLPADAVDSVPTSPSGDPARPLPSDLTFARQGKVIVTSLNGWDTVAALRARDGEVLWHTPVGVAPRDVVVVRGQVYVSNEAGRRPESGDFTNFTYDTRAVVEKRNGRARTGSVSQISLRSHEVVETYEVGLDPSALLRWRNELMVTNSSDDTVSVIDLKDRAVTRTFNVNPLPGQPYGSSPNALERVSKKHLAVSLGRNNALAIYRYAGKGAVPVFEGLVPTAWYPGKVIFDEQLGKVVVGNQKGVGALGPDRTVDKGPGTTPATGPQVYSDVGVTQLLDIPKPRDMAASTARVFDLNQWDGLRERNPVGDGTAEPAAVPRRIGDPSKIKHVFLIVKENRTYDQVLGDDPRGNGDPSLTQFGERYTPNQHALAEEFPLIDNLYSDGTNSATGHTWLDASFVNDYLERSYANYVRNYGQPDAMVYPKSGFLWDNALSHGLTARVWGEYAPYFTGPDGSRSTGDWKDWYRDSQILAGEKDGELHVPLGYYQTKSDVPSLDSILARRYPNYQLQIPDQYRAEIFERDLANYEEKGGLPSLNMFWVMADHTAGSAPGYPTSAAMVADNDLATGRMVDAISHSKFWKSSAIFILEDDSQNGVDHVDGHRNITFIASPYAKRGAVDSSYYTQLNVTRTIEQILGLPPMNQLDLAAEPMYDAFTDKPDLTPYDARPNRIPLDTMNPTLKQADSEVERSWIRWAKKQNFDQVDQLAFEPSNRMSWYTSFDYQRPFPGDKKVLTPKQVLKRYPQAPTSTDPDGALPETRSLVPHRVKQQ